MLMILMVIKMSRQYEMEKILNDLYKIALNLGHKFNMDTVYYHLTQGIVVRSKRKKINDFFPFFIEHFKNKNNIRVFNSPSWKYFCQFENIIPNKKNELFNPIKMYISIDRDNIQNVAIKLFDFLEKNNIYHESKIGSEVRSDNIVIRVFSKDDEILIRNFIKNNKDISSNLMKPIPFCFQQDGIGYALDGDLSYNCTVSKYIKEYISYAILNKQRVSLNNFYNFLSNIYKNTFIDKNTIDEFEETYVDKNDIRIYSEKNILNNYEEITKLLMLSIKENNFNYYLDMVDDCNDVEKVNNNRKKFDNIEKKKKDLERKIIFFNKAILETYKKYDVEQVIFAINKAKTGFFDGFTNNNNSRTFLINNLSKSDIIEIINIYANGDVKKYVEDCLNVNKTNILVNEIEDSELVLNKAIIVTYEKYGLEQVLIAVKEAYYNNDFGYFTNNYNARDLLKENVGFDIFKQIIQKKSNGNIEEYVNNLIKSLDILPNNSSQK